MNDSKPYHFKPNDVATMTGASIQTVRRWTDLFATLLSESANPAPGNPRLYTWADVEVIKQIKALRDQNVPVEAIADRLSSPTNSPATITQEVAPQNTQEGLQSTQALIMVVQDLQRQVGAIQQAAQQARQEDKRPRYDTITILGVGICIGLLFCAILIGLAWLYGG